jgi:hypothetical protein
MMESKMEIPEIKADGEPQPQGPKPCEVCLPLTLSTEESVSKSLLEASALGGCVVCTLFWDVCMESASNSEFDEISAWTGKEGVYGLCFRRTVSRKDHASQTEPLVVALAANGGK